MCKSYQMKNAGKGTLVGGSMCQGMDLPGGCRVALGNLGPSKECHIFIFQGMDLWFTQNPQEGS